MTPNEYVEVRWDGSPHPVPFEYGAFLALVDAGLAYLKARFEGEYGDEIPGPDDPDASEWMDAKETIRVAEALLDNLTPESVPDSLAF